MICLIKWNEVFFTNVKIFLKIRLGIQKPNYMHKASTVTETTVN